MSFGGALEQAAASVALLKAESAVASAKSKAAATAVAASRPLIPAHRIVPVLDPVTRYRGFRLQLCYPQCFTSPAHRFVSAFELRVELPPPTSPGSSSTEWQYLVVAAPVPYKTVAIRIPALPMDVGNRDVHWHHWDPDNKIYTVQVIFTDSPPDK